MRVPECEALKNFKLNCPLTDSCRDSKPPLPSYFRDGLPAGCWTAHTVLTLFEAISLLRLVKSALHRRGLRSESLALAALLHDTGKLCKAYLQGEDPLHNVTSALIALKVLSDATPENCSVAQAILLHHEHRMWEYLSSPERSLFTESYHDLLKRYEKKVGCVEISKSSRELVQTVKATIELTAQILDTAGEELERQEVLSPLEHILELSKVCLQLNDEKRLLDDTLAPKSFTIYYILQLADNRAAWIRDYVLWRELLNELLKKAEEPKELAQKMLCRLGGKSRVLLTLCRAV